MALAIVLVGVVGWFLIGREPGGAAVFSGQSPDGPPALALLSSHAAQSSTGDFWYVQGEIKNLTEQRISNIQAVTTWYDAKDMRLTVDTEMIDLKTLQPGQTSPFRTISRFQPNMSRFKVEFRSQVGEPLIVRNDTDDMPVVPPSADAH